MDGDARGGAALSMRAVTGQPIKLVGIGEKIDALEAFHPDRVASRILDMGDVVSLVEKVAETVDRVEAEKLAAKMQKGSFDLEDLASQLQQMRKMGGMSGLLGHAAGGGQDQAADGGSPARRRHDHPSARDRELDDRQGATQPADPARLAQAPDRHGLRHQRAGDQQTFEAAQADADHDEAREENGRRKQFMARGLPPGLLQR